jgi:3'(2'), 5'-bisphosphate nucleotidase
MRDTDAALARKIAETAGQLLLTLRNSALIAGKALGTAGDLVSHEFIMAALRAARPDDAILSEEGARDPARLSATRVWIVDPLDGTREFSEGRTDFAVHVALTVKGEACTGSVALPALAVTFCTGAPPPLPARRDGAPRIVISRTRPPKEAEAAAQAIGGTLVPMGSAGAKAMAVLRGEAEAYLHSGGQYEWDSCAPAAVAGAAGLHVSRIDGTPLRYNQADPLMPDLLICRKEFAAPLLAAVAAYRPATA